MPKESQWEEEVDLLSDLTPAQREAVTHRDGPLLILAGPGSGKTRVITRRVAHLIQQGVRPYSILAITFTNKAAGEMRQRVESLLPGNKVWMSTFHSFGAKILRIHGDQIGLDPKFTIYDQTDRAKVVKAAVEAAGLDNARFTPETIMGAISRAKNQLITPEKYGATTKDFFTQTVAHVYPVYEKKLRDANALDFDDLLYWVALALKNNPEFRAELDARFRYVLIDEYQDTNHAQYAIARGLSVDHPNLCVVGDPDQCLPPDTRIETPHGSVPIEELRKGDPILSAIGWGHVAPMPIEKVMVKQYEGKLVKVQVEGGIVFRATPNHLCFSLLQPSSNIHLTYLMWKRDVGYRIGITRGVRTTGDGVIASGLQVRANQEVADAIWILHCCNSPAEARYFEHFYSVQYGIPTMVFFVRGRRMEMTQEWIDKLFQEIDTETGAARLMADLHLDRRYPHHRPGGVTRGKWARRHVLFTLFGDHRFREQQRWHYHRIQLVTTGTALRRQAAMSYSVRDGSRGTWRIETSRKNYQDALGLAEEIGQFDETDMISRARLTPKTTYIFMPASHIHPGMLLPVVENGHVVDRKVLRVEWENYRGPVYDLSIPHTHNFSANRVIVHNSIYKFRGSDIRNILDFERDFPGARIINLGQNYRSTKSIIPAAGHMIAHNQQRKHKDLTTENADGSPVTVLFFESGLEEADSVARRIRDAVQSNKRKYRDFAIFVRINALTRTLETAFVKQRVPFQIVRGLAFYERKENRDVLAYLRLLLNPRDTISFLRIVNEPPRGIGKVSLDHLQDYAEPREMSLLEAAGQVQKIPAIKGKAAKGLYDFHSMMADLRRFQEAAPDELLRQVIDQTGYRVMLLNSKDSEDQDRLANVEELITAARQFAEEDSSRTIADFLESVTLASDLDGWDEQQDCVSVMTLHASKGLEFPVVYMLAVEQGILPHERSLQKDDELEEERRLAFVGMTRAKEELYLSHARMRDFRGQTLYAIRSNFLDELPAGEIKVQDLSSGTADRDKVLNSWRGGSAAANPGWIDAGVLLEQSKANKQTPDDGLAAGVLVEHPTYGRGKVTSVSGFGVMRKVKIRFGAGGERTFLADKVKLTVVK